MGKPVASFSSLLTRVLEYVGPRPLTTGTGFWDGYERQISRPSYTVTRWHLADLEVAVRTADGGNMMLAGQLCSAIRADGVASGVLSTRTEGLVQLPLRFSGPDADMNRALEYDFRRLFPTSELALLSGDGRLLGIGVAEFVQIEDALPVLKRLDPQYLQYRWAEDRWYYLGIHGPEPVNPGDGRWVLHCPGGSVEPWKHGLWRALGRAHIAKDHAYFYRENYSQKLANAARVAKSPQGASEALRRGFFARVAAWGVNTVFDLPPGWDVTLLESNGRGYEVFTETIKGANEEIIITLAGQLVTTTGGTGFANAGIHSSIRSDLIQSDGDTLASTLNDQAIPIWAGFRFGDVAPERLTRIAWDVTPPKDLTAEATAANQLGIAIKQVNEVLAAYGKRVDAEVMARRFGVPLEDLESKIDAPSIALAPADVVKIVKVNEGRAAAGLGPLTTAEGAPDPAGEMIVAEFAAITEAKLAPDEPTELEAPDLFEEAAQ